MNEAVRMRVRQRLCDLAPVLEQILKRQRVLCDQLAQGLAAHVLHHEVGHAIRCTDFANRAHVGVIEP